MPNNLIIKKGKAMRLRIPAFLIILFINMLLVNNLYSIEINFSAKEDKTGTQITPDSIRIINKNINLDTILVNSKNLMILNYSDVDSLPVYLNTLKLNQNFPNSFSDETRFEISMLKETRLNLLLSDELGKVITSYEESLPIGNHRFKINGSGLTNGIYFLTAKTSSGRKSIKISKVGEKSFGSISIKLETSELITIINKLPVLSDSLNNFTFIGYAKGYVADTIANVKLVNDTGIVFEMVKEIVPWPFQQLIISSYISKAAFFNTYSYRDGSNGQTNGKYWYDTTSVNFGFTMKSWTYESCKRYRGDTIQFCFSFGVNFKWEDDEPYEEWTATIIIDSTKNIFKILEFKVVDKEYGTDLYSPGRLNHFFFTLDTMNFTKESNGGYLGYVRGAGLKSIKNFKYVKYNGDMAHTVTRETINKSEKILDFSNDSYISIELVP